MYRFERGKPRHIVPVPPSERKDAHGCCGFDLIRDAAVDGGIECLRRNGFFNFREQRQQ